MDKLFCHKKCLKDVEYHTITNGPHDEAMCIECGNRIKFIKKKPGKLLPINIMGAIQSNSAVIYLTISDGKICRRVKSPTVNSVERHTKDGKLVNEEFYTGWKGIITDIQTRESDYGKEWIVSIKDNDGTAQLSFKYSSGYASSFLKALPNVNLATEVTITPKVTIEGEKKRTTIFLNQDGKAVKWYYTKDNMNGCPSLQQVKVKGVLTWDDSDMMEFLEQMVKDKLSKVADSASIDTDDLDEIPF